MSDFFVIRGAAGDRKVPKLRESDDARAQSPDSRGKWRPTGRRRALSGRLGIVAGTPVPIAPHRRAMFCTAAMIQS